MSIIVDKVSKLFRAYRLYNGIYDAVYEPVGGFQSSFELTGYITELEFSYDECRFVVSKLFRAYRLYNFVLEVLIIFLMIQFQSSFELTGYITYALWKVHEH